MTSSVKKISFVLLLLLAVVAGSEFSRVPKTSGLLSNEVFVWQRDWNDAVKQGIRERQNDFSGFIPLAAEVSFKNGQPEVFRPPLDWNVLRATGKPIGLALRIGPYRSAGVPPARDSRQPDPRPSRQSLGIVRDRPFGNDARSEQRTASVSGASVYAAGTAALHDARFLAALSQSLIATARSNQVQVSELQLDFDCAESKLADYRTRVETIKSALPDTPVTITALPSWLDRWSFRSLAKASDGYVLQVHSLSLPADGSHQPAICDPVAARKAVESAARIGVPFRVALPTYGYVTGFDANGRFLGLSAEGPDINWPPFSETRRVMTDAGEMAALVRDWTKDRPAAMRGLIWYRLPVAGDKLNWTWPTLAAVMQGREPNRKIETRAMQPRPGLVEIEMFNAGETEVPLTTPVSIQWRHARLIAGDGLGGFALSRNTSQRAQFVRQSTNNVAYLSPNQSTRIGWLRFDQPTHVNVELSHAEKL
mgnify:CR=1 FL=1